MKQHFYANQCCSYPSVSWGNWCFALSLQSKKYAQQLVLGIHRGPEGQGGVCSWDLAGTGQAADLLAMAYWLLNVDVPSTPLPALHSIPSREHTATEIPPYCPTPPCCLCSTAFWGSEDREFSPLGTVKCRFSASTWCLGSLSLANPFSARVEEVVSCARKRADVVHGGGEVEAD